MFYNYTFMFIKEEKCNDRKAKTIRFVLHNIYDSQKSRIVQQV